MGFVRWPSSKREKAPSVRSLSGCGAALLVPEADATPLTSLVAFLNTIDPPTPSAATLASLGAGLFTAIGCAACHTPSLPGPGNRTPVRLYSDLLLHDMGPALADGVRAGICDRQRVPDGALVAGGGSATLPARRTRGDDPRRDPGARRPGCQRGDRVPGAECGRSAGAAGLPRRNLRRPLIVVSFGGPAGPGGGRRWRERPGRGSAASNPSSLPRVDSE